MSPEPSFRPDGAARPRLKALVVCAHLRPGRDKRRTTYLMQPIAGLHVASLIDQDTFDVRLHHEDWHGPLEVADCEGYDIVFLSGLQVDFDRLRQLSFYFRRSGATDDDSITGVVARDQVARTGCRAANCVVGGLIQLDSV